VVLAVVLAVVCLALAVRVAGACLPVFQAWAAKRN